VLLGVQPTERGIADITGWADGWMPGSDDQLEAGMPALRLSWRRSGRPGAPVVWSKIDYSPDDWDLLRRIDRCRAAGVDKILLDVQAVEPDDTPRVLDRYAAVLAKSRA
jgi:hypothetical protein